MAVCTCSLGKCFFKASIHFLIELFVFLILSCTAAYIFCILTYYWSYHLQMFFSHSVNCLYILLMVYFAIQKLLIKSHLFIFAFVFFALVDRSKNRIFNPFWVFLHLVWENVLVSFFYMSYPVFWAPFIEETVFSPLCILASFCHRLINCKCVGLFLGSVFCCSMCLFLYRCYTVWLL